MPRPAKAFEGCGERTYAEAELVALQSRDPDLGPPIDATLTHGGSGCVASTPASGGIDPER